jgi:hypothetical protein
VSDQSHDRRDRMTVTEASKILGISEGAVRKRVERGKLAHDRAPDGRLIVYLDATATIRDRVRDESQDTTTERYVRSLEDQVEYLRSQLDHEWAANRENRRIIAALTSRIPELPAGTPPDERESPTAATEGPERAEPRSGTPGPQEAAQRPWWRRVFG